MPFTNSTRGHLNRRSTRFLQTLINPHQLLPARLRQLNELSQIRNGRRIQVMHDNKIPTFCKITFKRVKLLLRRGAGCPEPVFTVCNKEIIKLATAVSIEEGGEDELTNRPVDEFPLRNQCCNPLPHLRAFVSKGRAEMRTLDT